MLNAYKLEQDLVIYPQEEEFAKLVSSYNVIPFYTEVEAKGIDTVALFEILKTGKYDVLLESSKISSGTGRYSFIGLDVRSVFKVYGSRIDFFEKGARRDLNGHPIKVLESIFSEYKTYKNSKLPPFFGGAIGFLKYEALTFFENISLKESLSGIPDIFLVFYDTVVAFDHLKEKLFIITNIHTQEGKKFSNEPGDRIRGIVSRFKDLKKNKKSNLSKIMRVGVKDKKKDISLRSSFSRETFKEAVKKVKAYIRAGDIFQANISQRIEIDWADADSFLFYKVIRELNPSPFACYLSFEDIQIACSSPERLIKLEGNKASTRPIAGTRPKLLDVKEDKLSIEELFLSSKEQAEHIMLVDLERNDLGRVCEYGSVVVSDFMALENYSHVHHIVSNVEGILKSDHNGLDLIQAVFPGGTITGVPKIRCMEIIDEVEPVSRDIYTGAIGFIGYNKDLDFNIVIRTVLVYKNKGYLHVGAGIVADSDPEKEYYETLYKGEALFNAWEIIKKRMKR